MSAELGQLFDAAVENTRRAHGLASDPAHTPALTASALDILVQLDSYTRELGWDSQEEETATVMQDATADLRLHLLNATSHLSIATRLAPFPGRSRPTPLSRARTALIASKDLLATHRGPDRQPLTPYALLLAHAGPQRYLALRMADVAWELGRLVGEMATADGPPALCEELQAARRELGRAAVLGRAATREAAHATAFLLAAPATRPIPPAPDESPAHALTRLQDSSEQLLRISFDATRTSDRPRPSGSDWRQLARSLALTRLLSAQLLSHTDADAALRASLVQTARHWHAAAEAWHHIVDLNDPSAHPLLPKYDIELRRRGKATPLPRSSGPHPACSIATHMALRTGRLLFGPDWQPSDGSRTRQPRPSAALLADTAGIAPVLHALYRMSVAGHYLAASAPLLVEASSGTLVTDSLEHRPLHLTAPVRFYPAHHRQLEQLTKQFRAAAFAEDTLRTHLADQARAAGTPIARVALDAAVATFRKPAPPSLSAAQRRILQRITTDSQDRQARFSTALQPEQTRVGEGQQRPRQHRGPDLAQTLGHEAAALQPPHHRPGR